MVYRDTQNVLYRDTQNVLYRRALVQANWKEVRVLINLANRKILYV